MKNDIKEKSWSWLGELADFFVELKMLFSGMISYFNQKLGCDVIVKLYEPSIGEEYYSVVVLRDFSNDFCIDFDIWSMGLDEEEHNKFLEFLNEKGMLPHHEKLSLDDDYIFVSRVKFRDLEKYFNQ